VGGQAGLRGLVPSAAVSETAAMAGVQRQVAPETRHDERQRGEQSPSLAAARSVAPAARLVASPAVVGRADHVAVVDDGPRAAQARQPVDGSPCRVGRVEA